jgi:membrane protein implicated in regulation of membrane protease activity
MLFWGLFGVAALGVLRPLLGLPLLFVGPAVLVAAAGSFIATGLLARAAARLMPQDETSSVRRTELVGMTGKVVYPVGETGGRVHIFDHHRTLHSESARIPPGLAPIQKGTEVIVTALDPQRGTLIVEPLGLDAGSGGSVGG